MSRVIALFFVLFASVLMLNAAPVTSSSTNIDLESAQDLEKRLTHTGRGTWFNVGLGNCGKWNVDSDLIVAIPKSLYDRNGGSNCDQWIEVINTSNKKKVYAKTRDSCPSCGGGDLDLSPTAFKKLASLDQGVISIEWHFMNKKWSP